MQSCCSCLLQLMSVRAVCRDALSCLLITPPEHVLLRRSISLGSGTERAFSGSTVNGFPHDNKASGVYVGAVGGLPLFSSNTKFDSGALQNLRMQLGLFRCYCTSTSCCWRCLGLWQTVAELCEFGL